jgi:hypothetical protein
MGCPLRYYPHFRIPYGFSDLIYRDEMSLNSSDFHQARTLPIKSPRACRIPKRAATSQSLEGLNGGSLAVFYLAVPKCP